MKPGDKNSTRPLVITSERTSNSSQSTRSVGRVLWEELLREVIFPYVLYCIRF